MMMRAYEEVRVPDDSAPTYLPSPTSTDAVYDHVPDDSGVPNNAPPPSYESPMQNVHNLLNNLSDDSARSADIVFCPICCTVGPPHLITECIRVEGGMEWNDVVV